MFEFLEMVPPEIMLVVTTIGALGMGIMAMIVRSKSAKKPASAKKIILPPLFMSTGALMFVFPFFRVAPIQIGEALLVGALFSTVLIWSSKFEIRDGDIYLKQSKAFVFILIGLLLIRVIGKVVLSSTIDIGELGGMFWILAFGMIVPWRLAMYLQYKKLQGKLESAVPN
ncbi:cytochrome c biogenesis protein CcdC [Planococcus liqunii]|uniref:CcdC family protein n=1 Tax=Planococcus liqunii TaxID=3058394 RepID=UPI00262F3BC3|nr:cytochrome c biogenesis protein CcdC [Planococcus sp. N056]WKA52630.1 cytochrome c biogenesis protein CcdC [Planococcus sp. N056]